MWDCLQAFGAVGYRQELLEFGFAGVVDTMNGDEIAVLGADEEIFSLAIAAIFDAFWFRTLALGAILRIKMR